MSPTTIIILCITVAGAFAVGRAFERFVVGCLCEEAASNRQAERLGREVERVPVHGGING